MVCWRLISESTRSGIKRDESGNLPCEAALTVATQDGDFIQALMPLPSRDHGSKPASASHHNPATSEPARGRKRERGDAPNPKRSKGGKGNGSAGKAPKGKAGGSARLPAPLVGMASFLPDGRRLCYGFNMPSGCSLATEGAECPKGWRLCMEPGCGRPHPVFKH